MSNIRAIHPGEYVKKDCLEPLGLTVTDAAKVLGVTRKSLSMIINGHQGNIGGYGRAAFKAFGSTPEMWLRLQNAYELARVESEADSIVVERVLWPDGEATL